MAFIDSFAPFVEPGNARIKVPFFTPATLLESIEKGVRFCPYDRIASSIPGIFLSIMDAKASGVTSLDDNPVPPVKITRFVFCSIWAMAVD